MLDGQMLSKRILIYGIPLGLFAILIFFGKSSMLPKGGFSDLALSIDFLFTVPVIYFLSIRKTAIPKITIIPVSILGFLLGSHLLPEEQVVYFDVFKTWVLPFMELALLAFVSLKVIGTIKNYKRLNRTDLDFFDALKAICRRLFPKSVVVPITTEIAVMYYGFVHWKRRTLKEGEFSYHKESGTLSLLAAILVIVAIETVAFHALISRWNTTVAWVLSFLSIYSGIQIFGFLKSMMKRPHFFEADKLHLRYGIMNETVIDLKEIDSVELSSNEVGKGHKVRRLSIFGILESHNVILRLKQENTLSGLYGIRRKYQILLLHVDDKVEFVNVLKGKVEIK